MGYYIQGPALGKAQFLCDTHGAEKLPKPPAHLADIPEDKALICVITNGGAFDAAALAYNNGELRDFNDVSDPRPKTWLVMDKTLAHKLAGYSR